MSVIDYQGRLADLLVFHGHFPSTQEQRVEQSLIPAHTGGYLCTGIQKLAQRVLLVLLTKRGTVPYRLQDGVDFLHDADRGAWRTPAAVQQSFYASMLDLVRQLRLLETAADPADERIDTLVLLGITLDLDKVSLRIQLTSLAGSSYTFIAPLSVPTR